jgi:hypothetical protein
MADLGSLLGAAGIGGVIGRAVVSLDLDTKKYTAEMEAAQAKTAASTNAMGSSTSKYAGIAKAAFLGIGIAAVAGIAVAIKAGSDLNEQINKAGEVFEGATKKVIDFSKSAASGLGIAQSTALEATSNFGLLLEAAGFASDAAADMSIKMTTLGADLGSFNNIPVAEALEKIRAGLAGQARPLREVGVFLSAARVEAEAYSSGIAEVGAELTDAQKIQARYNIILEDTEKAQGDFQRTVGESLPNQLKVLQAELTNTAADLGIVLLPIVLDVVKALRLVVPLAKFAAENLGTLAAVLVGFAAFKYLPGLLTSIAVGMDAIGASTIAAGLLKAGYAIEAVGASLATAAPLALGFAAALTAGTAALVYFDPAHILPSAEAFNKEIQDGTIKVGRFNDAVIYGKTVLSLHADELESVADHTANLTTQAGRATLHERLLANSLDKTGDAAHGTEVEFDALTLTLDTVANTTVETRGAFIFAMETMERRSRQLSHAWQEISEEDWINPKFVDFLSREGPEMLIAFSKLTEDQQHAQQQGWRDSTRELDLAKDAQDRMNGALDKLDKSETKHKVTIEYHYEGFDPSKPGMSGVSVGHGGQQ